MNKKLTFGDKRRLKGLNRILTRVNSFAEDMASLTDEELQQKTNLFKARIQEGEKLESILPEAYAAAREASRRVLGLYPFDVQILGAIALFQGKIAEMKTGEGKTLTAVLPLYLHALTGKGCILVTMNDYLADRDGRQLKPLYDFLGVSVGIRTMPESGEEPDAVWKKEVYSADIVYTTNANLGFDYLIENLAESQDDKFLRPFHYCIIDEADAVLLDSANTPLVIAGSPRVQSNLYSVADDLVTALRAETDYEEEEGQSWLTEDGIRRAEKFFRTKNLFDGKEAERMRHIVLALRAHSAYTKDKNYVVSEDKIKLLDPGSGRVMENVKLQGGQHQAIERKERVTVTRETRAMASITFQDFFKLFPKLAGMTGSAASDRKELKDVFGLDVVVIPTNEKMIREDLPDVICITRDEQITKAAEETASLYKRGQPVLVIADSIETCEEISLILLKKSVPHNVLNAYSTAREAMIIAEAGRPYAVTVATSVAGRGTDIRLQDDAAQKGGLALIGIGRMPYLRQETQARGRSGRQGDPGFSRFYVSPDDEVVKKYGDDWLEDFRSGRRGAMALRLELAIRKAQRVSEENGRDQRRQTLEFGRSLKNQREVIYQLRNQVLEGKTESHEALHAVQEELIRAFISKNDTDDAGILRYILDNIDYRPAKLPNELSAYSNEQLCQWLLKLSEDRLNLQLEHIGSDYGMEKFLCLMTLKAIDEAWIEQVDYLQQLRVSISGRAYAGRDLAAEYHKEAHLGFEKMKMKIKQKMMRNILLGEILQGEDGKVKVIMP